MIMQQPTLLGPPRTRTAALLAVGGALALGLSACGGGADDNGDPPDAEHTGPAGDTGEETADGGSLATAELMDPDGGAMGTVTMTQTNEGIEFAVDAEGVEPGMYGLHVHEIGECEPDSAAPDDP